MNCVGSSRKGESDRYLTPDRTLRDSLVAELRMKLQKKEVKSCENLDCLVHEREKSKSVTIKKTQSLRWDKSPQRVKKTESWLMISTKRNGTIFGSNLRDNEMDTLRKNVPRVLVECCKHIENNLKTDEEIQGIYRVPGGYEKIQQVGKKLNKGDYNYLNTVDCVNILTGVVKTFLRESQPPLVCSEEIQKFDGLHRNEWCQSSDIIKCQRLKEFLSTLDPIRNATLEFILVHLKRLCDQYPSKLNSKIFSISIGPAIIRINKNIDMSVMDSLVECDILNDYVQFMIDNCFEIFKKVANDDEYGEQIILETCL